MKALQASDVAGAISEVLAGRWTQSELGDWAYLTLQRSTDGTLDIERAQHSLIIASLHRLMALAEGTEYATFEMTTVELEEMRATLSNPEEITNSS